MLMIQLKSFDDCLRCPCNCKANKIFCRADTNKVIKVVAKHKNVELGKIPDERKNNLKNY